ncbi:MAG TPA: helix-turn-helix domain-containing protein [Candidatus Sulfotelmatobacter sp.]|nr:helix-turn-helix domain-containing protein [Candidatus Sulfotelmatobacter sp.]HXY68156.1 helix-turn-helix domain-containing protein [Gemmatimonadales bacterium]
MSQPAIITLLKGPAARTAFRRAMPRGRTRVASCRSAAAVERLLAATLVDAIVVDARVPGALAVLAACRVAYPGVPRFAYSAFRPDEADLLVSCIRGAAARPIFEGVEDAVLADLILPGTASAVRLATLAGAPRLLRLLDPLQEQAWRVVMRRVGGRLRTSDIAAELGVSREHLSRQFGAGGAPNLKRVIDLARAATAADLLANPGYSVRAVARILGFASASHLSGAARRVAGVTARGLSALGPAGVLGSFLRGRTRSRSWGTGR